MVSVAAKLDVKLGATQVPLPPRTLDHVLVDNGGPISLAPGETGVIAIKHTPAAGAVVKSPDGKNEYEVQPGLAFVLVAADQYDTSIQYWVIPPDKGPSGSGAQAESAGTSERDQSDATRGADAGEKSSAAETSAKQPRKFGLEHPHLFLGQGAVNLLSGDPQGADFVPPGFKFENKSGGLISVAVYLGRATKLKEKPKAAEKPAGGAVVAPKP